MLKSGGVYRSLYHCLGSSEFRMETLTEISSAKDEFIILNKDDDPYEIDKQIKMDIAR